MLTYAGDVPLVLQWLRYLSPFAYGLDAFVASQVQAGTGVLPNMHYCTDAADIIILLYMAALSLSLHLRMGWMHCTCSVTSAGKSGRICTVVLPNMY